MPHKFLIKDIALQAGVSVATVDRVLNNRLPVRQPTKQRVAQAIAELEKQEAQIGLSGRKFFIDIVVEAPPRFCRIAESALTNQAPLLHPAIFRARFITAPNITDDDLGNIARKIAKRGSDGVILTVRDTIGTRGTIAELLDQDIPVVTLATDVTQSQRIAYAGLDNRKAGSAAAFMIGKYFQGERAAVLVTTRNRNFSSEVERELSFTAAIRSSHRNIEIISFNEGPGATSKTEHYVAEILAARPDIRAIYSIGGNNRAILRGIAETDAKIKMFIGHDLDEDNEELLRTGRIDFVLDQEMERDVRDACHAIMEYHMSNPQIDRVVPNRMQILTRFNL